jgi:hypothetical protein
MVFGGLRLSVEFFSRQGERATISLPQPNKRRHTQKDELVPHPHHIARAYRLRQRSIRGHKPPRQSWW